MLIAIRQLRLRPHRRTGSEAQVFNFESKQQYLAGQNNIVRKVNWKVLMMNRSHNQRASDEPSLRAGHSQRIGVPAIVIGEFRR